MASKSKTTTDHEEIRRWAEERGGQPAEVESTERDGETGIIRIDFPGYSGAGSLKPISWDEWFEKFDAAKLALVYQDATAGGQKSNFNKLVGRETAAARSRGESAASRRSIRGGARKSSGGDGRAATGATKRASSGGARSASSRKRTGGSGAREAPRAAVARVTGRKGKAAQARGASSGGRSGAKTARKSAAAKGASRTPRGAAGRRRRSP